MSLQHVERRARHAATLWFIILLLVASDSVYPSEDSDPTLTDWKNCLSEEADGSWADRSERLDDNPGFPDDANILYRMNLLAALEEPPTTGPGADDRDVVLRLIPVLDVYADGRNSEKGLGVYRRAILRQWENRGALQFRTACLDRQKTLRDLLADVATLDYPRLVITIQEADRRAEVREKLHRELGRPASVIHPVLSSFWRLRPATMIGETYTEAIEELLSTIEHDCKPKADQEKAGCVFLKILQERANLTVSLIKGNSLVHLLDLKAYTVDTADQACASQNAKPSTSTPCPEASKGDGEPAPPVQEPQRAHLLWPASWGKPARTAGGAEGCKLDGAEPENSSLGYSTIGGSCPLNAITAETKALQLFWPPWEAHIELNPGQTSYEVVDYLRPSWPFGEDDDLTGVGALVSTLLAESLDGQTESCAAALSYAPARLTSAGAEIVEFDSASFDLKGLSEMPPLGRESAMKILPRGQKGQEVQLSLQFRKDSGPLYYPEELWVSWGAEQLEEGPLELAASTFDDQIALSEAPVRIDGLPEGLTFGSEFVIELFEDLESCERGSNRPESSIEEKNAYFQQDQVLDIDSRGTNGDGAPLGLHASPGSAARIMNFKPGRREKPVSACAKARDHEDCRHITYDLKPLPCLGKAKLLIVSLDEAIEESALGSVVQGQFKELITQLRLGGYVESDFSIRVIGSGNEQRTLLTCSEVFSTKYVEELQGRLDHELVFYASTVSVLPAINEIGPLYSNPAEQLEEVILITEGPSEPGVFQSAHLGTLLDWINQDIRFTVLSSSGCGGWNKRVPDSECSELNPESLRMTLKRITVANSG